MKHYIGVDIGGTNIACAIVDESGTITHKQSIKTESANGYESVVRNIAALVTEVSKTDPSIKIESVGVGCPGVCNKESGVVEVSNNLGWRDVPLVHDLRNLLDSSNIATGGTPVLVDNDANAAALVCGACQYGEKEEPWTPMMKRSRCPVCGNREGHQMRNGSQSDGHH
ncbi:MAG: ROK family protein [Oscillospiraceae bacterium]|nr:ROK family protein [Oscillospiraceae bacterium]